MPDQGQALVTYSGVQSWEDWDFTDTAGVAPAMGVMTIYPQMGYPSLESDIVMTHDGRTVTLKKMRADAASFARNSGGQIVSFKVFDERWRWQKGYVVSGKYNTRLPSNEVDPYREKKPIELVDMLFAAMDVTNYVADIVRDDANIAAARPDADWDVSNPAQELQSLLDSFGLRLVPRRSDGMFVICRTGEGITLEALGRPYQDPSEGIDPQENPDAVAVYTAPIRWQVRLELEAVGQEIWDTAKQPTEIPSDPLAPRPTDNADGSIKPIDQLTYTPKDSFGNPTWVNTDEDMEGVDIIRVQQPDGSYHSPQDLARHSVYKYYRVKSDDITIPGYSEPGTGIATVKRKQLILTDELAEEFIDPDGERRMRPAFCDFIGWHRLWQGTGNSLGGTRLDSQSKDPEDPNEVVTFSIRTEQRLQLVAFSTALMRYPDGDDSGDILPAKVWLTCAVEIRDPVTWQPIRHSRQKPVPGSPPLGPRTEAKFVLPLRKDDIKQFYRTYYTIDPTTGAGTVAYTTDNSVQVDNQIDYYLNSQLQSMQTPNSKTLTLIGLWPFDMDGAINQVSYTISKSGADTKVSRGTEHDFRVPAYKDQQQRNKRNKIATDKTEADIAMLKFNIGAKS